MMEDIRNKKIKLVIVYRLDRISRNVSDFCGLKDEFSKYNVDFISVTENFDTSTPMGVAMLMISSVFAQLERDTIAERIRDNMYELAKTGRWLGGTTPLGYKSQKLENISLDGKKRSLYKLDQIPEDSEKVKLIWNKMSELKGTGKLETYLINNGIKTRNGVDFSRFALVNIFQNPVYVIADKKIKEFFESLGATVYADEKDFDGKR
jgi:site-specific DNA recombinase